MRYLTLISDYFLCLLETYHMIKGTRRYYLLLFHDYFKLVDSDIDKEE